MRVPWTSAHPTFKPGKPGSEERESAPRDGQVILLALTVGTILAGIIGAVLSVPLTAVAWTVIKTWSPREAPAVSAAAAPALAAEPVSV